MIFTFRKNTRKTFFLCGSLIIRMILMDSDFGEMLRSLMALPRYGTVDEIAAMVAYLVGPEAGFVTGASLTIDGGFTA
jgi:NAD(P)-dependent dehydrogenase (short-subunit alcohol dehydrogenase family)